MLRDGSHLNMLIKSATRLTQATRFKLLLAAVILVITVSCASGVSAPSVEPTATSDLGVVPSPGPSDTPTPALFPSPTTRPTAPEPPAPPATNTVEPTATMDTGGTPSTGLPTPRPIIIDELLTEQLGGDTTAVASNSFAFEIPALNLTNLQNITFWEGDAFFTREWVAAPTTDERPDGLGPLYNAVTCASCHVRDGKGRPPENESDGARGLLIRLSIPQESEKERLMGPLADPIYGGQIQDRSISGVLPEGRMKIAQVEIPGEFADGTPYTILKPVYSIADPAYGPLHEDVMMSPRVAPAMLGLGLLEAIPDEVILAQADPDDLDGDGISGRVNRVHDIRTGEIVIGRFGWKAGQPSVAQQVASAFIGDLGITSSLFPNENCTETQTACLNAPNGGEPEISDEDFDRLVLYSQSLAVTAMRDIFDPAVRRGAELFVSSGCSACHTPSYVTGEHEIEAFENQLIFPYTDLLLHDMGPGLADNRPEFAANGQEWRTPPLWGIGLTERVSGHTRFLHDGRARNLTEAILWHGGEASASKEIFESLSAEERENLIRFLQAL